MQNQVPVTMGDKIIGAVSINMDSGQFRGQFDQKMIDILREGFSELGAQQLIIQSIMGMAAQPLGTVQERFAAYLKEQ